MNAFLTRKNLGLRAAGSVLTRKKWRDRDTPPGVQNELEEGRWIRPSSFLGLGNYRLRVDRRRWAFARASAHRCKLSPGGIVMSS